jgi:alpha-L-fucosidase
VTTARHLTVEEAMAKLETARRAGANLLLNTGPLADGSIHPEDAATLRATGERIGGRQLREG